MNTVQKTIGLFSLSVLLTLSTVAQQTPRPEYPAPANENRSNNQPSAPASGSQLGNYRNERVHDQIPLEAAKRQVSTTDLQAAVVELLELYHDAKQSHWNVRGPLYFPLHHALQEYAELCLRYTNILSERVLEIGNPVDGRVETIAQMANLPKFPGGYLSDRQVLDAMTERIYTVAKRVRGRIDSTAENGDGVTSNKFQDLSYELDKQVWQFRVHQQ